MNIKEISLYVFFGTVVTFSLSGVFMNNLYCHAAMKNVVPAVTAKTTGIEWQDSFANGLAIAKKEKKPVMVDFYAEWCGWCKKLDKTTYLDQKVIGLSKKFICVKVDTDKDQESPAKYGVRGLPTIVFFNSKGEVTKQAVGYQDGAALSAIMEELSKK
jgi:thiol:disulfide interchange protein DsbD